ncbi:solute carrier family 25 member 35-like [Mya arenaria]|uniref:solute carrier family 25 member 35-like n=1 Tax=Mya arenaria TaxID=6604 RepID=UPI0022DF06B5|nr:solute carrier family 25 member 35-like [Mya arenaria]XP_052820590.1 solute carrier family 25 member 35-like [Mya arenaria]XP_052820592.1 solute carrier family 25 member 35-like [Mya arenaria]
MGKSHLAEFSLGGIAACCAGVFTNPLEVVKTRMQLQGELQKKGNYTVHYRNSFHAFITIGKTDGIPALQKGLVPALWFQLFMNGVRLGSYQIINNSGITKDKDGNVIWSRNVLAGAAAGCMGAAVGSPFYMVKTQLQARANASIAVGTQHPHDSMFKAFTFVVREHGVIGLWRGTTAAVSRVMVGSAVQLSTFSSAKEYVISLKFFQPNSFLNSLIGSICGGVVVVACMTPFDVVSTRMYNQPVNKNGKGIMYKNLLDCFVKIFTSEGLWGFYKGWGPSFFRLVPHTVLSLVFWDQLRILHGKWNEDESI